MPKGFRIFMLSLILLPGWGICILSQELSHQVLVPAAGIIETNSVSYSQTIGETAIVTVISPEFVLTQGFQQPNMKLESIIIPVGNGVDVYPNPAIDFLTIKLFGEIPRKFRIDIINITGTIVFTKNLAFSSKYYYEEIIPVDNLTRGIYFIRVSSTDNVINRTFKIEKM